MTNEQLPGIIRDMVVNQRGNLFVFNNCTFPARRRRTSTKSRSATGQSPIDVKHVVELVEQEITHQISVKAEEKVLTKFASKEISVVGAKRSRKRA